LQNQQSWGSLSYYDADKMGQPPTVQMKKKRMRTVPSSQAFRKGAFLVGILVGLFGPLLYAQEIHIRALNAHNGKPIANECINIWFGSVRGASMVAPINNEGVIVLHLVNSEVIADAVSPRACNGIADVGPRPLPKDVDTIFVRGAGHIICQEYGKIIPGEPAATSDFPGRLMPSYSIKKILDSGVSAANTCGKFRAEAKPGELIFYVRPRSFSERMRQ